MINLEEEIKRIKDNAKAQIKRFKQSGYSYKHDRYSKQVQKDSVLLMKLQVDPKYANIPLHPIFQKYLATDSLKKLELPRDEILVILEEIFDEEFKSFPKLRKETIEKYEKNIEQRFAEQRENNLNKAYEERKEKRQFENDKAKFTYYKNKVELLEAQNKDLKKQIDELKAQID